MLMNFLKRYAPVLMFVAVLGLCVWIASMFHITPAAESDVVQAMDNKRKVETSLNEGKVTNEYAASEDQAKKIKYVETLKLEVDRNKRTVDEPIGVNVSFPLPARPKSEAPPPPPSQDDLIGVLPFLKDSDMKAEADRGKIYVRVELPKAEEFKMMEPVRIEVFRGLSKDKVDQSKPWGVIELGLENPPAKTAGNIPVPIPVVVPDVNTRQERIKSGTPAGTGKPAPPFPLPATERVFRDTTDVQQQTEYFYKARLIGRFTSVDGKREIGKRPDGTQFEIVHHVPNDKNVTAVAPSNPASGAKLFATPLTAAVSAKTPTNFDLRISGINGSVPPLGFLRPPSNHDNKNYSVNFEVRVWIPDLGDWRTAQLQSVTEGDMLSGKVSYLKGEKKEYDFTKDLGYKLYEVNMEEVPAKVGGGKEIKEIIQLENQRTKAMERFEKESKHPDRKPVLNVYDKVIEAQNREMKKLQDAAKAAAGALTPAPVAPVPAPVVPPTR